MVIITPTLKMRTLRPREVKGLVQAVTQPVSGRAGLNRRPTTYYPSMKPPEALVLATVGLRGWPASRLVEIMDRGNDVWWVTLPCLSAWPKRPSYLLSPYPHTSPPLCEVIIVIDSH